MSGCCLAVLIFHYFLVWRRERFIIHNFKETLTVGRLHVRDIIVQYPTIRLRLRNFNSLVFKTSVVGLLLQVVNVISSGVLCFVYYNDGYKTFTTFFTNLMLISLVLWNCLQAAYIGLKHELAYSCVACQLSSPHQPCKSFAPNNHGRCVHMWHCMRSDL